MTVTDLLGWFCEGVVAAELLLGAAAGVCLLRLRRKLRRPDARGGFVEVGGIPMQRRN